MVDIEAKLGQILKKYPSSEQKIIRRAFEFSEKAHSGQLRKSGDPYITHPLEVALILSDFKLDVNTIAAALLHDVSEDTEATLDDIKKEFGEEIEYLVEGMTKVAEVRLKGSYEPNYIENLRKMFIAAAQDLRVVLIKLADRLHNMRTLQYVDKEKQESLARETLEIFAPLADRLGIGGFKGELEDLAFPYVYPKEYQELTKKIDLAYREKSEYMEKAITEINNLLKEKSIEIVDIHGRAKHIYSLYKKLQRYDNDITRITDLMAVRIIAKNTSDCYTVLGLLHEKYKPLPGRIKDYISIPKPNGYQSLHTTVFGPDGEMLEIQIRSEEMHDYAEHGIAAHWAYHDAGKPKSGFVPGKKMLWVKQLRDLQQSLDTDPKEFMRTLKLDIFQHRIFCFTPKGDVIDLPAGSTPVDFAYAVHSDLGDRCQGALVNKKMYKINKPLENGDVVEILTSKNPVKVKRDWLQFVKTSRARERIKKNLGGKGFWDRFS